jgi:MinD-like ATPase involved in chromosome partitioning or flagellar assembly
VATIVSVHSFRGGTGKSNTTANVAAVLAGRGKRVGVIDGDIQSPGIHVLFGLAGTEISGSLNDFLWHGRDLRDVAVDVTPTALPAGTDGSTGKVFLIPSSMQAGEIARVLREGYDAERLTSGLRDLVDHLSLDLLLIDTHPGLNEETLLSLVISDVLLIVLRPDRQDYEGTGITVRVARELAVPTIWLVVNKTPPSIAPDAVAERVTEAYDCRVAAVMPHSDELMTLASEGLFSVRYPDHPVTEQYRTLATRLMEGAGG